MATPSASNTAPLATPAARCSCRDSNNGIVFTNNMRDRQARGKPAYVDQCRLLMEMKQRHVANRLQQEQQRQQEEQRLYSFHKYYEPQLLKKQHQQRQQHLVNQKRAQIQSVKHHMQAFMIRIQQAQQLHHHLEQQQMQLQYEQLEQRCNLLQQQYQEEVQRDKQCPGPQRHAAQDTAGSFSGDMPTSVTDGTLAGLPSVEARGLAGGLLGDSRGGMPEDDLPDVVGRGPYWDIMVEA